MSILDNRENDNEILDAAAGDLPESKMMGINALFDEKPLTYAAQINAFKPDHQF